MEELYSSIEDVPCPCEMSLIGGFVSFLGILLHWLPPSDYGNNERVSWKREGPASSVGHSTKTASISGFSNDNSCTTIDSKWVCSDLCFRHTVS